MDALIGTGVTTTQEFRDESGDLADPTTVTMTVREPDGTTTTYVYLTDPEVERDAEGVFSFSIVPDAAGLWGFRWLGTGTVPLASEEFVTITPSRVL